MSSKLFTSLLWNLFVPKCWEASASVLRNTGWQCLSWQEIVNWARSKLTRPRWSSAPRRSGTLLPGTHVPKTYILHTHANHSLSINLFVSQPHSHRIVLGGNFLLIFLFPPKFIDTHKRNAEKIVIIIFVCVESSFLKVNKNISVIKSA